MRPKNHSPEQLGSLIEDLLETPALANALLEKKLSDKWENILGARLASLTKLESFAPPTIKIRVEHPAWKMELSYSKESLLEKFNENLGKPLLSELIIL